MEPKSLPSADEIRKLPADGGPAFNRLIHETSPYLLQHARNPVDWYPWGPEAIERAKREDKPLFVSIGYSSCHWCHVMEHESFENERVAELLNRSFIPVKVDREERPDIDDVYMVATQLMTGRGGWPNSVWLTPAGTPWYAGTYFPREDRMGQAGFITILTRLADVWTNRRRDVEEQARQLADAIRQHASAPAQSVRVRNWRDLVDGAVHQLTQQYDLAHGGFGDAPKFPPHTALALLLYENRVRPHESVASIIAGTLDAMMMGGIRDHLGGGFHRYSTDARWLVPHFEKMLYDNAQLARSYAEAYEQTSNAAYRAVAREVCDWVLRDMTSPDGGFFSALDADSEGVEGKFYTWTQAEILDLLGPQDGAFFCGAYQIDAAGNYRDEASGAATGLNIPHLATRPAAADEARLSVLRERLRATRDRRVWPGLDDKVLVSWNGLMIGALAYAGRVFEEPRYADAAARAARFILADLRPGGHLCHTWRQGVARVPAYLDDYAALALGLLDLDAATGDHAWRNEAQGLVDEMLLRFEDREHGGFFTTSPGHETLLVRSKDAFDQAMPSGNGLAALALVRLGDLAQQNRYDVAAFRAVEALGSTLERIPTGTCSLQLALDQLLDRHPHLDLTGPQLVALTIAPSSVTAQAGASVQVRAEVAIRPGWHIQAHEPLDPELVPTTLELAEESAAALENALFPEPILTSVASIGERVAVYSDTLLVPFELRVRPDAEAGSHRIRVTLHAQSCDDRSCQRPEEYAAEITLVVEKGPTSR